MTGDYIALLVIVAAAVICPLVSQLIPRRIVPETVLLLLAGAVLGPNLLGVVQENDVIRFLAQLGMAFQFLLAGYEIDPKLLRGSKGRKGLVTWMVTLLIGLGVAIALVDPQDNQMGHFALAIAMTSTAFGTVVSILKERGQEKTPLGSSTLSYGVWGQLGPVVAIAFLLSPRQPWKTALVIIGLVAFCIGVALLASRTRNTASTLMRTIKARGETSSQMFLRIAILLLVALVTLSSFLGLNIMLGAFAAGFILSYVLPEGHKRTEVKLGGIGYGFLIPVFFVESGMKIDLLSIGDNPLMLAVFMLALVLVRAIPVFVAQSVGKWHRLKRLRDRAAVSAYCTTALSIIVIVSTIAVDAGALDQKTASTMVAAAALSVLLMPLIAQLLHGPEHEKASRAETSKCRSSAS